jgi:hypothetical protein
MNKLTLAKIFGGLGIILALLATVIDGASFLFPVGDIVLQWDPNPETAMTKLKIIIFVLVTIGLLPLIFGIISFYLAGAIGDSWASLTLMALFLLTIVLLPIIAVVNKLVVPEDFQQIADLIIILMFLCLILSPIVFSVISFAVGKVSFWKQFMPILAFVFWILSPFVIGGITYATIKLLKVDNGMLYRGATEATVPQWLMLGSFIWILLSLPAFIKDKDVK